VAPFEYGGDNFSAMYRFAFRDSHWDGAQALPGLMFYREEDDDTTPTSCASRAPRTTDSFGRQVSSISRRVDG
jgi:hypothetical protein